MRARFQDSSFTPLPNPRFKRGSRRYIPDVVERIRVLVEGTGLSQAAVAARIGVSQSTVWRLTRRHGWTRPAEVEPWTPILAATRAGLGRPLRIGYGRVEALAERERRRLLAAEGPDAAAVGRAARLVEAARQAGAIYRDRAAAPRLRIAAASDGLGLVRLSARAVRPFGRRADDSMVALARDLVERTATPQAEIARHIGVDKGTLSRWRGEGGWVRPADAPHPAGPRVRGRARRNERTEARRQAQERMAEAERALDRLEQGERADLAGIGAALRALGGVRTALRRRPLGAGA